MDEEKLASSKERAGALSGKRGEKINRPLSRGEGTLSEVL